MRIGATVEALARTGRLIAGGVGFGLCGALLLGPPPGPYAVAFAGLFLAAVVAGVATYRRLRREAVNSDTLVRSLQDTAEELAVQKKIRSAMLADVSHELRTPLTGMMCELELLEVMAERIPEEPRERLHRLTQSAKTLSRRLEDLMTIARGEADAKGLAVVKTDLHAVFDTIREQYRGAAEGYGVDFSVSVGPGLQEVWVDPDRIQQILENLVFNSLRELMNGGVLAVRARAEATDIVIEVEDDGPGIAPDDLPHIFERFNRGQRAGTSGTGLGLAIVQRFAGMHGGKVEVDSTLGVGSVFTVRLPLHRSED